MNRFIIALLCVAPAFAHHSMAGFERTKSLTLTGTVKQFKWANPHSWIEMDVPNEKGGVDVWNVEMTAPGILARAGWKSTYLKPGDKVSVVVRPMLNGDPGGLFVSVTLPDGRVLTDRAPQQPPAAAATKQ
jgi:Family of unknown function (DUF6152)